MLRIKAEQTDDGLSECCQLRRGQQAQLSFQSGEGNRLDLLQVKNTYAKKRQ